MDRIKNLISPRSRRKKLELGGGGAGDSPSPPLGPVRRVFGVPLQELMARGAPEAVVPHVVSRICEYIYRHGLDSVGLFRVSGSVRLVERMRLQFELMGDSNLEEENDVPAAAGLLRVFLRDLPDTLIPGHLTQHFFSPVKDPLKERDSVVSSLKDALVLLPEENYRMLKYISSLLVVVAAHEQDNKMSAYALAIVFGPNVFKYELNSGPGGLRDMDASKDVMQMFITEYNALFAEEGEPSPVEFWREKCKEQKSTPPSRPPPPKLQSLPLFTSQSSSQDSDAMSMSSPSLDYRPIPSPRKIKNMHEIGSPEVGTTPTPTLPAAMFSPRDEPDHFRAHSPFGLESETHSIIESPMITARTHEFVEQTIVATISEHIFGAMDFNQNSGPDSPSSPQKESFDDVDFGSSTDLPVVKPRMSLLSKQHRPGTHTSQTNGNDHQRKEAPPGSLRDFDSLQRMEMLTGHKKPLGPPRRSPSRKHRRSWETDSSVDPAWYPTSNNSNLHSELRGSGSNPVTSHGGSFQNQSNNQAVREVDKENEDFDFDGDAVEDRHHHHHNGELSPTIKAKSMRWMEDRDHHVLSPQPNSLHNGQLEAESGPASHVPQATPTSSSPMGQPGAKKDLTSPSHPIKLFIPPLDLTTLHQHVDGVEAIPVSSEIPQAWVNKPGQVDACQDHHLAVISPRSNKKRNGASTNTDIPPSPPIQQDLYKKHGSDDEGNHRLRQLTKRIQGLKKKVKSYEESFERDHGYKPSHGEKAAQPDIKRYITELTKARKDLKRLKEDTEKSNNRSRHNSGASSSGMEMSPPAAPTVSNTLDFILRCLMEKRKDVGRPDDVMLMSREQVYEEKLAVQRALLHFEGLHGRPTTKGDKDLMRPLYDRYRSIKRILAKPMSPRNSVELQTVPEDQMIEIPVTYNQRAPPVHIPTALVEEEIPQTPDSGGGAEFLVTRDFTLLRELDLGPTPQSLEEEGEGAESGRSDDSGGDARLHELSLTELHVEIEVSRGDKKHLRRVLRDYEEVFWEKNGRKVSKEDRHPLQNEYSAYKKVKARLRLLEALVQKHNET